MIDDRAVQVSRESSPELLARYLAERGIEQALVAPVRGETRLSGVMILGDRLGSAVSFTDEDLRLFETLANHAGLSLEFDRLEREAQSDPLTGLSNRGLFLHRVEASLKRAAGSVTVLFLDLDDFKAINDGTGHAAGDAVLGRRRGGSRSRCDRGTWRRASAATSSRSCSRTWTTITASWSRGACSTCSRTR